MILFGGRNQNGKFLSDTWVFTVSSCSWEALPYEHLSPPPPPRVFTAMCSINNLSVLLFGGTDGAQNFGDIWIFRGQPSEWRWERGVTAGLPPQPRYGHSVVVVEAARRRDVMYSFINELPELEVIVLGGCAVNPVSEISGASEGPIGVSLQSQMQAKELAYLNKNLQNSYHAETKTSQLLGEILESSINIDTIEVAGKTVPMSLKAVYHQASQSAGLVAQLEAQTREAENAMLQEWYNSQALHEYNKRTAKHPKTNLDVFILSITDMVWQQKRKDIKGIKPSARAHFSSAVLSDRYLVVCGGIRPTALAYKPVDKDYTKLHIFDSHSLTWTIQSTASSAETMEEPIHISDMEIYRLKQLVELEHRRGMMLGAPGGLTKELVEAQRVLEIGKWRKEMLIAERDSMIPAPDPRWGMVSVSIGKRILMYGGWLHNRGAGKKETLILDVEDDLERLRRLEDEFQARIERERIENEIKGRGNDLQSAFELRMLLAAEREREHKETEKMMVCDILSRLPELTKPKKVRCIKSNEHTIWLEWQQVAKDAYGKPAPNVEYIVSMSGGYVPLGVGDRVKVIPTDEFLQALKERQREAKMKEAYLKAKNRFKTGGKDTGKEVNIIFNHVCLMKIKYHFYNTFRF